MQMHFYHMTCNGQIFCCRSMVPPKLACLKPILRCPPSPDNWKSANHLPAHPQILKVLPAGERLFLLPSDLISGKCLSPAARGEMTMSTMEATKPWMWLLSERFCKSSGLTMMNSWKTMALADTDRKHPRNGMGFGQRPWRWNKRREENPLTVIESKNRRKKRRGLRCADNWMISEISDLSFLFLTTPICICDESWHGVVVHVWCRVSILCLFCDHSKKQTSEINWSLSSDKTTNCIQIKGRTRTKGRNQRWACRKRGQNAIRVNASRFPKRWKNVRIWNAKKVGRP